MLQVLYRSTAELTATLADADGQPVTGATVTATIVDRSGKPVEGLQNQAMADQEDGTYLLTIPADALELRGHRYRAQVTAVAGASRRYAEVTLYTVVDAD